MLSLEPRPSYTRQIIEKCIRGESGFTSSTLSTACASGHAWSRCPRSFETSGLGKKCHSSLRTAIATRATHDVSSSFQKAAEGPSSSIHWGTLILRLSRSLGLYRQLICLRILSIRQLECGALLCLRPPHSRRLRRHPRHLRSGILNVAPWNPQRPASLRFMLRADARDRPNKRILKDGSRPRAD